MLDKTIYLLFKLLCLGYLVKALESVDELCRDMPTGYRIPHPEKCSLYLECTNNVDENHTMMFSCEKGVNFNPTILKCDSNYFTEKCPKMISSSSATAEPKYTTEKNVKSTTKKLITSTEEETNEFTASTTESTILSNSSTTTEINSNIITCPWPDLEQITFIKNNNDCTKYSICYHGKPLPLKCWLGLHWNDNLKKCTPPEIADCNNEQYPSYPECPQNGYAFLPHPSNCQYFLFCQNGIKTVQQCGLFDFWDINEKKCKRRARAICYSELKQKRLKST